MKYLVIATLVGLLALLVYSRLHPYIQIVKKILGTVKSVADAQPGPKQESAPALESKLVRCVGCGTWVPADRAFGSGSYCSADCFQKASTSGKHKAAS